jgi:hypothetical protein
MSLDVIVDFSKAQKQILSVSEEFARRLKLVSSIVRCFSISECTPMYDLAEPNLATLADEMDLLS